MSKYPMLDQNRILCDTIEKYKKQIADLKTLVLLMHGDRRLPDYFQDMANDILSEERGEGE